MGYVLLEIVSRRIETNHVRALDFGHVHFNELSNKREPTKCVRRSAVLKCSSYQAELQWPMRIQEFLKDLHGAGYIYPPPQKPNFVFSKHRVVRDDVGGTTGAVSLLV